MSDTTNRTIWEAVTRASSRALADAIHANTAAVSALADSGGGTRTDRRDGGDTRTDRGEATRSDGAEAAVGPGEDLPSWESETPSGGAAGLAVGDRVTFAKAVAEEDVQRFAVASGDTNPVHLDDDYASETRFDGRIAHGGLVSGLISAALARLPGTVIYLSQDLEFQAPVRIGDRAEATVEIVEDLGGGRFRLRTTVDAGDRTAVSGEAVVLVEETDGD